MIEGLTIENCIEHLRHFDQFQFLIEEFCQRREQAVRDLENCETAHMTMRGSGKIMGMTEILDVLTAGDYSKAATTPPEP